MATQKVLLRMKVWGIRRFVFIVLILALLGGVGGDLFHWGFHFLEEEGRFGFPPRLMAQVVTDCGEVKRLLKRSGTAVDAREGHFGKIDIKGPGPRIPTDSGQATWWGQFKPFRLWGRPRLRSRWLDPEKKVVSEKEFRGLRCRLAKVSLPWEELPGGRGPVPGVWEVQILCRNETIDSQEFLIYEKGPGGEMSVSGEEAYPEISVR